MDGKAGNAVILDRISLFKSKLASLSAPLASSWVICTDKTWIRGDMSGFVLNEYVGNTSNVSCTQDICLSRSGPERLVLLVLFSRVVEDLVRNTLLGQSFVLAIGSVQHVVLDTLSQASTTRSVLRNWDICSFMVSRPFVSRS